MAQRLGWAFERLLRSSRRFIMAAFVGGTGLLVVGFVAQAGETPPPAGAASPPAVQAPQTSARQPLPSPSPQRARGGRSKGGKEDKEPSKAEAPGKSSQAGPAKPLRGQQLYEQLLRSTAWVAINLSGDWSEMSWGTGWLVDRDRKRIITNHHVVAKGAAVHRDEQIRVYFPQRAGKELMLRREQYLERGKAYRARVFDSDAKRDLAVLQLDAVPDEIRPLELAAEPIQPGEAVYQLGNPLASDAMWVFTSGTVRQVYRARATYSNGQVCDFLRVETQSPTNPGDSGGPVINERGELVAIHNGSSNAGQLMTYFIDARELKEYLREIEPLSDPQTAEQFRARGQHYYKRQRYDRAVADFTEAIRRNPRFADALASRGLALSRLQDYDTAVADFDEAIRLQPSKPQFFQGRGRARLGRKDFPLALNDFTQAIRLAPQEAAYYGDRGDVHYAQENYPRAVQEFSRAIELDPRNADYRNSRGVCYAAQEDYERAIADYTEAIRLDADEAQYYYNRATAYHASRRDDKAARDLALMERLDPEFAKRHKETYQRRYLKIQNQTGERITVWLKYHTRTNKKQWKWFPAGPDENRWSKYTFEPDESAYVSHEGFRINADRVRISAHNDDKTRTWEQFENEDLVLADEEYSAYYMGTFEFTFR